MRLATLPLVVALAGCQLYWTKPEMQHQGAAGTFFTDHRECVVIAGTPRGAERVFVNLDIYRACLRSRGWQRVTGAKGGVGPGIFRGQEDEGPVAVGEGPPPTPAMTGPPRSRRGDSGPNFGPR